MKRLLIFVVLWPLIVLAFLAVFSDSAMPGQGSVTTNLKWIYAWTIIPALLLGVFDWLVAKFRYGFVGVVIFAGAAGLALTYSVESAIATAVPTLVCCGLTGWLDGRWAKRQALG